MSAAAKKDARSGTTPRRTPANLDFPGAKTVQYSPGSGVTREGGNRDGASFICCPGCGTRLRLNGDDVEVSRKALLARGSLILTERIIELVCEANGLTLAEVQERQRNPAIEAVRRRAAQAARASGADASTIGLVLRRNQSTINKLAPKKARP